MGWPGEGGVWAGGEEGGNSLSKTVQGSYTLKKWKSEQSRVVMRPNENHCG